MTLKAKLLLLEDESALNETITEYLEEQGYEVVPVFDGEEAEEKLYETSLTCCFWMSMSRG